MKWFKNNSLSLVFLLLFLLTLAGQFYTGLHEYNTDLKEEGGQTVTAIDYLSSGHFLEATFENFESEFLQMALFIVMSAFLYQKGSSESKDPDEDDEADRTPDPARKGAPWPVRKGGVVLWLYQYSLSIVFFFLFAVSFVLHFYGSLKHHNQEQLLKGLPADSFSEYMGGSKFWFESFQNWQSEFLSVFSIVILTIFLRHKGSAQSKPVDAPNSKTGE